MQREKLECNKLDVLDALAPQVFMRSVCVRERESVRDQGYSSGREMRRRVNLTEDEISADGPGMHLLMRLSTCCLPRTSQQRL